jgi:hypothetical protein
VSTAEIRRHWSRVASLGCLVSHRPHPTLHHVHGGSVRAAGVTRGKGQKTSDWLVIPLDAEFHTGRFGIDSGSYTVEEWEATFGRQAEYVDEVCARLGVDVWAKAGIDRRRG